jgi:peptide/nickel transport system ATP-binding protein
MFISHDLKTVRAVCDDILVLYAGRIAEKLPANALAAPHHHPYTQLLMASVPELRTGWLEQSRVNVRGSGKPNRPGLKATGCAFADRCPHRIADTCERVAPPLRNFGHGNVMAYHRQLEEL